MVICYFLNYMETPFPERSNAILLLKHFVDLKMSTIILYLAIKTDVSFSID